MNYYPFHLGDYASHTAHLEPMEDLAYRRMLDLYYRTEKPLPGAEDVARLIRMREFVSEVARVLCEFFKESPEGWTHSRCEREIASFAAMVEGGRKGAAKRWGKPKDAHPIATPSTPQWHVPQWQPEPEPEPEPKKTIARASRLPTSWKLPKAWGEWSLSEFPAWNASTVRLEADKFRDFWTAKAGKDGSKLDWCATWRNWCRNAKAPMNGSAVTLPSQEAEKTKEYLESQSMTREQWQAAKEAKEKVMSAIKRTA